MIDRLKDLKDGPNVVSDIEMGDRLLDKSRSTSASSDDTSADGFMSKFFKDVATVKARMLAIKSNLKLIEDMQSQVLTAVSRDQKQQVSQDLDRVTDETNAYAQQVKLILKTMDRNEKELDGKRNGSATVSESRIRSNMQGTLTRKFMDLMTEFQTLQTKYKTRIKETIERQCKIVNPEASQEDIDKALERPDNQVFATTILKTGPIQAKNALLDIQERHKDFTKLEQSLKELHQLFLDMSILVESQGELLDQIEVNVNNAVGNSSVAVKELHTARKRQISAGKMKCCIITTIIVVLLILLAPLINYVTR
mmetsp:Transcript_5878/g.9552  ORF Transcript_5878/g.9552 Transcript_5878/m.9552 type:complete len:310 (+) Transcript_5878:43-972(+)